MSAGSLLAFCVLALNLLQGYGCSGANGGKQEWQTPPRAEEHKATPKGDQKKMDDLVQRILKKDPTATLLAKQIGPDAASAVRHLVTHEDPVVRELALRCLEQSGGDGISSLFGAALLDESPTVRAAGLSGLNKFLNPSDQKALLVAFDRWAEAAEMQEQVALLFGRIKGASPDELRSRLTSELAPLARQGVIAALAKLGDRRAREEFSEGLRNAKDADLKRYLNYADYINEAWVAVALQPILFNKTPVLRIAVDGLPHAVPNNLRACDVAVNLIARIFGKTFSFQVNNRTNYTDEQLREVHSFITTASRE